MRSAATLLIGLVIGWVAATLAGRPEPADSGIAANSPPGWETKAAETQQRPPEGRLPDAPAQEGNLKLSESRVPLGRASESTPPEPHGIETTMQGIIDSDVSAPTPEELERRFGSLTVPELRGAEAGIAWVAMKEFDRLVAERFELGLYEAAPANDGRGPLQTAPSDGSLRATSTRFVETSEGGVEARTAVILPGDSPFMDARYAELRWLVNRIHELEKLEEDLGRK